MKALLGKDFRQNGRMFMAVGVFLILPYVIAVGVGIVASLRAVDDGDDSIWFGTTHAWYDPGVTWEVLISGASVWSLILAVFSVAFIAGNAMAGERADRSAEFIAYLPIPRRSAIASKASVAVAVCLLAAAVNLLIGYLSGLPLGSDRRLSEVLCTLGAISVILFGASWLFSNLLRSPAIAAACGLGTVMSLGGIFMLIDYANGLENAETLEQWFRPSCLVFGPALFLGGIVCYLRRIEP